MGSATNDGAKAEPVIVLIINIPKISTRSHTHAHICHHTPRTSVLPLACPNKRCNSLSGLSRRCPAVRMPHFRITRIDFHPTEGRLETGTDSKYSHASAIDTSICPLGLARLVASDAKSLLGPIPAEAWHPVSSKICDRSSSMRRQTFAFTRLGRF